MNQLRSAHEADPEAVLPQLPSQLTGLVGHNAPVQGRCTGRPGLCELCIVAHLMGRAVHLRDAVTGVEPGEGGGMVGMLGDDDGPPSCPEMR